MARTTDDFEYTHRPTYQNITGAGSTGFEPWKNIGRPMTAPDTWDPFGNFDPFGGGLYRTASQRDPGILADLLGRGGGDTPPLDTGYKIDVNVVADLLKGLIGSPDRTPTESPTTQSQLGPEAQAQNIAIIAEMLKAEEVKKRNPQFTDPYAGLEGKIASLGNVTTDQGGGQPAGTAITPLRETLDVDPDLLEKAQYAARVKSGEIVPPPDFKADVPNLEPLFSEISKTPIRPAIDETQLRQDLLSQPPPGKPWDQLTKEEQQDLYNKAIEQGKKKELEKAAAQAGAGLYGTGRGIMQGEFDPLKPPPPKGILANLAHLLKDPGFQKLAATGIIAATGGAGRGREAQAAVKAIEQGEALRLKRETLRQEQADKLRTRQIEAERISREKFNKYLDLVKSGASPAVVGPLFNMNPEQMVRGMLIASQMYEKENAHRVDQLTGDMVPKDDPRWNSAVGFPTQGEALKMSEQIKEARVGEGNWATPLLRDLDKVLENQRKLNDSYRDNLIGKEEFDNQTEANKRILNFLNSKLNGTQSTLETAIAEVFKDDPEGFKAYQEDIVEKSRRVPQDKPPDMITTWGVGADGEPKLATITGGTQEQQEQAIAKAVLVGQQKKGFELIDSSIRVMRLIQKMVPVTDVFSVVPLYAKIQGWKNVITEIFGESMAEITREDADQILSDAQIDAAKTTEARYKEQGLVYSPEKTVNLYKIRQQYEDYFARKGLKTNMYRFSSLMVALSVKLAKLEEGSRLTDEDIIRQRDKILGVVAGVPPTPASVFQGLGVAMEASVYDLQEGSRMAKTTAEDQLKLRGLDDLIQYLPQLEKGERTKKLEQEDRHKQRISNWKTQFESEVGEIPSYLKDSIDPSGKITKSFGVNMRQTTGGWIRADLPEGRNIYEVMTSKDKEGSLMFEFILGE